jgi:hypothetical protein
LKLLREYAQRNDLLVTHEFVDVETAKKAGRKNFGAMIKYLEKSPNCRVVLAEKTDRLYRNLRDCLTLEDLDLEIHLPKEGQIVSKKCKIASEIDSRNSRCLGKELHRELARGSKKRNAGKGRTRNLPEPPTARISKQ